MRNSSTRFSIGVPVRNSTRWRPGTRRPRVCERARVRVLDVVRLVDDEQRDLGVDGHVGRQPRQRAEGGHRDAALAQPAPRRRGRGRRRAGCSAVSGVCLRGLVQPVDLHAGRADDEEPGWPLAARCAIAARACTVLPSPISSPRIERSWWMRVLRAEHLVAAQGRGQQRWCPAARRVICWRSSSGTNPRAASSSCGPTHDRPSTAPRSPRPRRRGSAATSAPADSYRDRWPPSSPPPPDPVRRREDRRGLLGAAQARPVRCPSSPGR